jgi:hypothetical protein
MEIQPNTLTHTSNPNRRIWPTILAAAAAMLVFAGEAWGQAPQPAPQQVLSANPLDGYIAGVARAWEPFTTPDGRVADPLNPADTGDNYGVIRLADVMLKVARRTGDSALEAAGERILSSALTLPVPNDPFNLLAIAAVIHDGRHGELPPDVWDELSTPLIQRAGEIGPPTEASCLVEPLCYDNWRLVWSAGASLLLSDDVSGIPGSLAGDRALAAIQIKSDLMNAVRHVGAPLEIALSGESSHQAPNTTRLAERRAGAAAGVARELSDPGAEPPAYELFSTFMLELIGEVDPQAITPAVARLRGQADRYALDMMAPDGQLSMSGRSLDQSWVQAAGAALGARRAMLEGGKGSAWRTYADRAFSYLLAAYPIRPDGVLPIVPGLDLEWNQSIMDGYAALNQYEGLTLWLLSDALAQWPRTEAPRAPLPSDSRELLAEDLGSSGLVWGRAGGVWWQLSGRNTSGDPRSAQGLVAVKLAGPSGWHDLLALRPRHRGLSSAWTLESAHAKTATPVFTRVHGTGRRAVLSGFYEQSNGHLLGRVSWTLGATTSGVRLSMSMPSKTSMHATVWLAGTNSQRLHALAATTTRGECVVSASGRACPVTVHWHNQRAAVLEIDERSQPSEAHPQKIFGMDF